MTTTMTMFIIIFALYITFWAISFGLIKSYISNLITSIRKEVFDIALLAKDYLKK